MEMEEQIEAGSKEGNDLGFNSEKFYGHLRKNDNEIYIMFIRSFESRAGNYSALLNNLWSKGYSVKVVDPALTMEIICIKKGFLPSVEEIDGTEKVVWYKP